MWAHAEMSSGLLLAQLRRRYDVAVAESQGHLDNLRPGR